MDAYGVNSQSRLVEFVPRSGVLRPGESRELANIAGMLWRATPKALATPVPWNSLLLSIVIWFLPSPWHGREHAGGAQMSWEAWPSCMVTGKAPRPSREYQASWRKHCGSRFSGV
jgi:hypothetical protein